MRYKVVLGLFCLLLVFGVGRLPAWDYIWVSSGYMVDDELADKDDYEITPVYVAIGRALNDKWDFELEPFVNPVIGPETNVEFGLSFNLVWHPFGKDKKLSPYLKGGTGPGYTTQHTNEQGSQWNFFSFAGAGIEWKVNERCSLSLEYRIRHFSNAGLEEPNKGVNTQGVVAGMKARF